MNANWQDHLIRKGAFAMKKIQSNQPKNGDFCEVIGGTHAGKSGTVRDIKTGKTGHVTITIVQKDGERFKTLARNVLVKPRGRASQ